MTTGFSPSYQSVLCPVCGDRDGVFWRMLRGEATRRCQKCGHIFADPMPTEATMIRAYALPKKEYVDFFKCDYLNVEGYHQNNYRWQLSNAEGWVERIQRPKLGRDRLFELGCASGFFLEAAQRAGWQTAGVDPALLSRRSNEIDQALGIQRTDLFSARLEECSFDVVFAASVLEHLVDPLRYIEKLHALLKRDGRILILGLPNIGSLSIRLGIDRHIGNHPPIHLQYFSRRSMSLLLRRAGFGQITIHSSGLSETILEAVFNRGAEKYSGEYTNLLHQDTVTSKLLNIFRRGIYGVLNRFDLGSVMEISAIKEGAG